MIFDTLFQFYNLNLIISKDNLVSCVLQFSKLFCSPSESLEKSCYRRLPFGRRQKVMASCRIMGQHSVVDVVTRLRAEQPRYRKGNRFFSPPKFPDRLLNSSNLLVSGGRRSFFAVLKPPRA